MIQQKTVLILGAGASKPYGFPLGLELCQLILSNSDGMKDSRDLEALELHYRVLMNFNDSFRRSGVSSIDEFLSTREDYIEIGKILIAKSLLPFESEEKLFDKFGDKVKENWYKYLLQSMFTNKLEDFGNNQISFVTFNYDRSLEHFLFNAIKERFNVSNLVVSEQLNKIKFVHLHGQLGFLSWQSKLTQFDESSQIDYGGTNYSFPFIGAAKQIKIIHEADSSSPEFDMARDLIEDAQRVYFLGFGYNKESHRRLKLRRPANKIVAGTALNMGAVEIENIVRNSNSFVSGLNLHPVSIMDFFKNHHGLQ